MIHLISTTKPTFIVCLFLTGVFILSSCELSTHTDEESSQPSDSGDKVFSEVEEMPEPSGGMQSIYENLKYPQTAREEGKQGQVVLSFIVDQHGTPTEITVEQGISDDLNQAAKEAISKTEWKPGKEDGENVSVKFQVPIQFQLAGEDDLSETEQNYDLNFGDAYTLESIVVTGYGY